MQINNVLSVGVWVCVCMGGYNIIYLYMHVDVCMNGYVCIDVILTNNN